MPTPMPGSTGPDLPRRRVGRAALGRDILRVVVSISGSDRKWIGQDAVLVFESGKEGMVCVDRWRDKDLNKINGGTTV